MKDTKFGKTVAELLEGLMWEDDLYALDKQTLRFNVIPRHGASRVFTFEVDGTSVKLIGVAREHFLSKRE